MLTLMMRPQRGSSAKCSCFQALSGHFGGVLNAAGGDDLHLSEQSAAEKMKRLKTL